MWCVCVCNVHVCVCVCVAAFTLPVERNRSGIGFIAALLAKLAGDDENDEQ